MQETKITGKHRAEYFFFSVFIQLIRFSPLWMRPFNRMLLRLIDGIIGKRHRTIVTKNLQTAFPEYEENQRKALRRKIYRHYAMVFIDNIYMFVRKHPERLLKNVEIRRPEILAAALAKQRGVIVFSAHFGNWELVPCLLSRHLGAPIVSIARKMDNPLVERVILRFRERMGSIILYKKNSLRGILKNLEQNRVVYLLTDQNAIEREAAPVRFFGQEVQAIPSAAQLYLRKEQPVVPLFLHYEGNKVVLEFLEEISWVRNPARDSDAAKENLRMLTQHMTTIMETQIRKHPEQWFWFHNRFKKNQPRPARSET